MATSTRGQIIIVFARLLSGDPNKEPDDSYDYLLQQKIIDVDYRKTSGRNIPRYEIYIMMYRVLAKKDYWNKYIQFFNCITNTNIDKKF